jgi:hypothetical protein
MTTKPILFEAVLELVGGQITGGADLSKYVFHDGQTPPTEEEAQKKLKELQDQYDDQEYARSREKEYPSFGHQLDYIFHHGLDKWKTDIVQPVKDKFPKPK